MSVEQAIERASGLLPGKPAPDDANDPRWQAVLEIGNYIESDPEEVWQFVRQWAVCPEEDVRDAIACCILEHLLEYHFSLLFPRVEQAARENPLFADTFARCWRFGQSDIPPNSADFDRLQTWCRQEMKQ